MTFVTLITDYFFFAKYNISTGIMFVAGINIITLIFILS